VANIFGNSSCNDPVTKTRIIGHFLNENHTDPDEVTQRYINLACAIIEQGVDDWKWLSKFDADTGIFLGSWIKKHEIMNFFYSPWFETLLDYALPDIEANEVRYALKVGQYNKDRGKEIKNGNWVSKYYVKH